MLCDHIISKPATTGPYASHQLLEGLTDGSRPQYADMGDHLIVRSSADLTSNGKPLREVREGDVIGFELRASCGVKVKGRHRYFAVKNWRSRHEWLDRKAEASGFKVLTVNVTATQSKIEKRGKTIRIDQSDFCGILKVTDAGAFQHALENGVGGTARAFGRGMLII